MYQKLLSINIVTLEKYKCPDNNIERKLSTEEFMLLNYGVG